MYLLVIFLSLIGSFIARLFGRYLEFYGSAMLITSCLFFLLLIFIFLLFEALSAKKGLNFQSF